MDRLSSTSILLSFLPVVAWCYNVCDSSLLAYKFDGYTYKLDSDSGEKVWTHCSFPSPLFDYRLCGWPMSTTAPKYICDPDDLLLDSQANYINSLLEHVQAKTDTMCIDSQGRSQSFRVGVVLINRIRIPDLLDPQLCINDCGMLYPAADNISFPTASQQYEVLANFADHIRTLWQLGACENDVIILYSQEFNKVYISRGSQTRSYLSDSKLDDIMKKFVTFLDSGQSGEALTRGLKYLIDSITVSLRGFTVAMKLLIACMLVVVLFAVGFFFYLVVREKEMDVWGREQPWKLFEWFLFSVTGLYVIEGMMYLMIHFSHKGLNFGLLASLIIFILCVIGYYISRVVLDY